MAERVNEYMSHALHTRLMELTKLVEPAEDKNNFSESPCTPPEDTSGDGDTVKSWQGG